MCKHAEGRSFGRSARLPGSRNKMKLKQLTGTPGRLQTAKNGNTAILRAYRLETSGCSMLSSMLTYVCQDATAFAEIGARRTVWGGVCGLDLGLGLHLGRVCDNSGGCIYPVATTYSENQDSYIIKSCFSPILFV